MPRKAVQLATRMAIASRLRDNEIVVIDELNFGGPKTKEMAAILKSLKLAGETTLVTTAAVDANVYRSSRNIQGVTVSPVADLNALAVLTPKRLLVTKAALDEIRARAARAPKSESAEG